MDEVLLRERDLRDMRETRAEVNRLVERVRALEAENRELRDQLAECPPPRSA